MRIRLIVLTITLLVSLDVDAQTIEGKKVVGGHGYAMYSTYTLRQRMAGMQNVPLDGIMVAVNRNDYAGDPEKRMMRPLRWFQPPAVTIDDFSIALDDLANTDFGRFKHNVLWTGGTRSLRVNFFDEERWESVVCNNARVMAEICNRLDFEAVWFDVEVGGSPSGGHLTWNSRYFKDKHPFEEYQVQARKCGFKLMKAFTCVKPDFKLIISHAYGSVLRKLAGRDSAETLAEISYSLLPSFLDGMLEGCGEYGRVVDSGEGTYGTMTYAAFKAWREWDQLAAEKLSEVPHLVSKNYRHAMALWPDFRSDANSWNVDDFEKNHFSPERLKHAIHNAMVASDEFVWTYTQRAHWWHHHLEFWPFASRGMAALPVSRVHFGEPYFKALADAHAPMDLNWHPERSDEEGYDVPRFDAPKVFSQLDSDYQLVSDLTDGWLFHAADYSTPAAFDWALPLNNYDRDVERVYQWRPVKVGDYWENQGISLDGTGVYRMRFIVPKDAHQKHLHLAIAGIAGRATIYLGHRDLRATSVGRTAGEGLAVFDVTDSVDVESDNVLSIVVASPGGPGGIYGAVRLVGTDPVEEDKEPIDLSDPQKRVVLYDWEMSTGARLVPRDVPRLNFADEVHGKVIPESTNVGDEAFAARLTLQSSKQAKWGWPAISLVDFEIPDWSAYNSFGVTLHNPTKQTQHVGLCVRDGDKSRWGCDETFAPGETKVLGAGINELRSKLLMSDIASLTVFSAGPKSSQVFLISPVYLVTR